MARGWGGGRVNCGRVHAIFNQEITPLGPHPNLILFDLLHCYKKLIHAVGDHHRPRKNARSLRTVTIKLFTKYLAYEGLQSSGEQGELSRKNHVITDV
jgi:hypothetical protein